MLRRQSYKLVFLAGSLFFAAGVGKGLGAKQSTLTSRDKLLRHGRGKQSEDSTSNELHQL